ANLRLLLAYQYTRPGKQLVFMGTELAQEREWDVTSSLDWHLLEDPQRQALQRYMAELGKLYKDLPPLWRADPNPESFSWNDCSDWESSIMSYVRRDGDEHVLVVLNFTPVPRENYRIGAPRPGRYLERLSTNDPQFGGSDYPTQKLIDTDPIFMHNRAQSLNLNLPPLGALILVPHG